MEVSIVRLKNNETDLDRLVKYLNEADSTFDVPLSNKVYIPDYAKRKLSIGRVLAIEEDGEIGGILAYYCNDKEHYRAYVTLYCAREELQRRGITKSLLYIAIQDAKKEGMKEVYFDVTDRRVLILHRRMGSVVVEEKEINGMHDVIMKCDLDVYMANILRTAKPGELMDGSNVFSQELEEK